MSLYAKYLEDRTPRKIIESEFGFITYEFTEDGIYIVDVYTVPEARRTGECFKLADMVLDIAKSHDLKFLYGSVCPAANNSTESLKVLLAYGFKLKSSFENFIYFYKEI